MNFLCVLLFFCCAIDNNMHPDFDFFGFFLSAHFFDARIIENESGADKYFCGLHCEWEILILFCGAFFVLKFISELNGILCLFTGKKYIKISRTENF